VAKEAAMTKPLTAIVDIFANAVVFLFFVTVDVVGWVFDRFGGI
jgi:hypothetical protein